MKIATWNISAGINTNDYVGEFFDKEKELNIDDECLNSIANEIISQNIDVVALQEVVTTDSFKYMQKLSQKTGLSFFESFENSPCHLIENANFGIVVLSRYPLEIVKKEFFANPHLTKQTAKGLYKTHEKAYMCVKVNAGENVFNFITTQLLPFHRFDAQITDFKHIFTSFQDFVLNNNVYVLGDFNAIEGKKHLEKVFDKFEGRYQFLFDEVTTVDGKKCDNIILPRDVAVKNSYIVHDNKTSDHFMCVAEI